MLTEIQNAPCTIIAGPCSISDAGMQAIYDIARIRVRNPDGEMVNGVCATRDVGLKSRSRRDPSGNGMGIDWDTYERNARTLIMGGFANHLEIPPSVIMAGTIYERTGLAITTEICDPHVQLPPLSRMLGHAPVMIWGPSVNALGHHYMTMGAYAAKHPRWLVGIKNPKWLGDCPLATAQDTQNARTSSMEETWAHLESWTALPIEKHVFIQRGVEVEGKGKNRNAPLHAAAVRLKRRYPQARIYFDPSHSLGPKRRDRIVDATIEAMLMRMPDDSGYAYDGALIEAGPSETDTQQHISVDEVAKICEAVGRERPLVQPDADPHSVVNGPQKLREVKGYE
ncbi:MAG TPA: hypothetical protein PKG71_00195 [Candidatus Woesebacteria bacterium]|nr:hypothetical protein [Candidatus Woesebacteria bacterium]HNS94377.1 hypothetical protein [Candidatus Woesebacteria bacterium]